MPQQAVQDFEHVVEAGSAIMRCAGDEWLFEGGLHPFARVIFRVRFPCRFVQITSSARGLLAREPPVLADALQ